MLYMSFVKEVEIFNETCKHVRHTINQVARNSYNSDVITPTHTIAHIHSYISEAMINLIASRCYNHNLN